MAAPVFVADELVTASKMNLLPKGILGYAQVVANQASIGTSEVDLTSLTVTVTVAAGRRVRVTGQIIGQQLTSAGIPRLLVHKASVQIASATSTVVVNDFFHYHLDVIDSPAAGSHTYKLRGITSAGTYTLNAAANFPAFILVEDIGAV